MSLEHPFTENWPLVARKHTEHARASIALAWSALQALALAFACAGRATWSSPVLLRYYPRGWGNKSQYSTCLFRLATACKRQQGKAGCHWKGALRAPIPVMGCSASIPATASVAEGSKQQKPPPVTSADRPSSGKAKQPSPSSPVALGADENNRGSLGEEKSSVWSTRTANDISIRDAGALSLEEEEEELKLESPAAATHTKAAPPVVALAEITPPAPPPQPALRPPSPAPTRTLPQPLQPVRPPSPAPPAPASTPPAAAAAPAPPVVSKPPTHEELGEEGDSVGPMTAVAAAAPEAPARNFQTMLAPSKRVLNVLRATGSVCLRTPAYERSAVQVGLGILWGASLPFG